VRLNAMALVGMSAAGKTMDDPARKRVVESVVSESLPVLSAYSDGSGLVFCAEHQFGYSQRVSRTSKHPARKRGALIVVVMIFEEVRRSGSEARWAG
jgi:hypothetical protein